MMAEASGTAPRRFVVLGASNVAMGLPLLVETTRQLWGGPLQFVGAFGHGRSYGLRKSLLVRELPGILTSGLWDALARQRAVPTAALLTDIGNDLLYDAPVADIAAWVEACVDRLQQASARVALTPLPLCSAIALSPARYLFFRSFFFPGCRISFATLLARAHDLDRRLRAIAAERQLLVVEHQPHWYGFDPIHIRWRHRLAAWRAIVSALATADTPASAWSGRCDSCRWLRLHRLRPERRWMFGQEQHTPQPAARLPDGTTIALY